MKKYISLIKACMTSDMNIFKIKQKKDNKKSNILLFIFLCFCFMFTVWSNANMYFEQLAPLHLQDLVLPIFVFMISFFTIIEGAYKTGPLLFNCKDDQLLLSLPLPKRVVLFVRIFKFYVFELMFNTILFVPLIIAYLRWAESLPWTFYLSSIVMIFFLPIIPIVISCIIGTIITSLSSHFKLKNFAQIVFATIFIMAVLGLSLKMDKVFEYLANHATSVNDFISKLYYPSGAYYNLVTNFHFKDLILFIVINLIVYAFSIYVLSTFYFKINTRLKNVTTTSKKVKFNQLVIKKHSVYYSIVKKELATFFNTPVFIVNAGFGLVLYLVIVIAISIKESLVASLSTGILPENFSNMSVIAFLLILFSGFMTSITNSLISLEGKNINILKSLPIETKTILLSKILSCLVITTPVLFVGNILLWIRFRLPILHVLFFLILSILVPLASHFIGIIINLKYPKLDFENATEVVKQSASSFLSVMIGMILLVLFYFGTIKIMPYITPILLFIISTCLFALLDFVLYLYMTRIGVKEFQQLSI